MTYEDKRELMIVQSLEEIRSWLVARVAFFLERSADEIDVWHSLTDYGLDSVFAFTLSGEIEDVLGVEVEPISVWELDTIAALSDHLIGALDHQTR